MIKKILLLIVVALLVLVGIVAYKTLTFKSVQVQVEPVEKIDISEKAISNLSAAIQIPTISFGDKADIDYSQFDSLRAFIDSTYPNVKQQLTRTLINNYSLLYKWQGTNTNLKPAMLIAHFDVVPVEEVTLDKWEQPPFSGKLADGILWGRGTLDDKVGVFGILEAAEKLLAEGYQPERTIYFGFGHDEEIGGGEGAVAIVKHLQSESVELEFVLDEGMAKTVGLVPGIEAPTALIGLAEKGYTTLQLTVDMHGGHSSTPAKETAIGVLAHAIVQLQDNPLPPKITEPVEVFMNTVGPEMKFPENMVFANMWLFETIFIEEFSKLKSGNAMVRTTTAPTIFRSGIKDNAIPNQAQALVNFRILPGNTPESVIEQVKAIINDERVVIEIYEFAITPSPVSPSNSYAFKHIERTIRATDPEAIVAPTLVIAATDARHYTPLTDNIYRYLPIEVSGADLSRIHGINERIETENYKNVIRFYYQLMKDLE